MQGTEYYKHISRHKDRTGGANQSFSISEKKFEIVFMNSSFKFLLYLNVWNIW